MKEILKAEHLCKYYGKGEYQVKALEDVSLSVQHGEFVAVVGKSGSGKSTLLHLLGGLDTPTNGHIFVREQDISKLNEDELAVFRRRKIGFVFQSFNLISSINVWENIVLPLGLDNKKPDERYLKDLAAALGIEEKLYSFPSQLSGGQQQQAAIARALSCRPDIILADEPTGNLDSRASDEVVSLLKSSSERYGQTVVMITHDEEIAQIADRILAIEDGRVVERS